MRCVSTRYRTIASGVGVGVVVSFNAKDRRGAWPYFRGVSHHAHAHGHAHPHAPATGTLRAAFFLNLTFTLVELAGGLWTNSFAVLSDALHDLGDCLVLGTAWYLQRVALKGRDAHYSYGYARYSMLGGWGSAMVLLLGAMLVFGAAIPRLLHPPLPHTQGMMALAVFGLVMNGAAAWMLHRGSSLNERGAYLHLLEDVLGWAAVLVGAVAMYFTGWAVIDPLLSMAISAFIAVNALRTLRTGTGILMQRLPEHVDAERIRTALTALPHVRDVHDQHAWSLDGNYVVLTVHLVVDTTDADLLRGVKEQARHALHHQGVQHATIEIEQPDEVCELQHH
ncbi:MAG: cation transporter [Flavobacteriales bacterium]|nr:cation transporter [Flavobacteriales bacterium]